MALKNLLKFGFVAAIIAACLAQPGSATITDTDTRTVTALGNGVTAGTADHIAQEQKFHVRASKNSTPSSVTTASSGIS